MTELKADQLAKRYGNQLIFKGVDVHLSQGDSLVITGNNGSGKSTLLKVLAGFASPNLGSVAHVVDGRTIRPEDRWEFFTFTGPYHELYNFLTLRETWLQWQAVRGLEKVWSATEFCDAIQLPASALDKPLQTFSSGMLQRVKLGMIFYTPSPFVFLDEPLSNLDKAGREWYVTTASEQFKNRIVVVASNRDSDEYQFCNRELEVSSYK